MKYCLQVNSYKDGDGAKGWPSAGVSWKYDRCFSTSVPVRGSVFLPFDVI